MNKSNTEPIIVAEVAGAPQAELIRSLLEAQGITAVLSEESAARAIGVTLPGMGLVQILVRAEDAETAFQVIADYQNDAYRADDMENND